MAEGGKSKKAGRNKNKRTLKHFTLALRRKIRHVAQSNIPWPPRLRHCGMAMFPLFQDGIHLWKEMHGVIHKGYFCQDCKKVKWVAPRKNEVPADVIQRWTWAKQYMAKAVA